jgi:uncharacterized protein (TIGR02246 family)
MTEREDDGKELMRVSREWAAVARSGDLEKTLAYWADDAVMLPPGQPPLRGKEAIREYLESAAHIPGFAITWEPIEAHVAASGDIAYLMERNEVSFDDATGARVTETNKAVTVWRKQPDGSWKNVVDIWNAEPPAGK